MGFFAIVRILILLVVWALVLTIPGGRVNVLGFFLLVRFWMRRRRPVNWLGMRVRRGDGVHLLAWWCNAATR